MAKIEAVDANNPDPEVLRRAAKLVLGGEVIVCPTDTGYAFSVNALDQRAVVKVFELKGRLYSNPIHVAVSSMEEATKYAHLNKAAEHLACTFLPGALTLVLQKKEIISAMLVSGQDTIGIRIPDNRIMLDLAAMTNLPLTATSANISGRPTPYAIKEVVDQPGETIKNVALVLDQGPLPTPGLSTIVDLTIAPPRLLRQGLISWEKIQQALKPLQNSSKV